MLKLTRDFISIRRLPFSDKYPTILTHYILDSIVPILINIVIASMLVKPKPEKRKFNLPKMVHFFQSVALTFIAISGLSIEMIDATVKAFISPVTLHILGALKHHFFDRGDKLKVMLGR